MVSLSTLLDSARDAGLTFHQDGERMIVRGPRSASDIAQQLLAHKSEVLATLTPASSSAPPAATELIHDPIPASVINQVFEQSTAADGSHDWKMFPLFIKPKQLIDCDHCGRFKWWRSIFGTHLICGACHPPSFEHVVAEWITPPY